MPKNKSKQKQTKVESSPEIEEDSEPIDEEDYDLEEYDSEQEDSEGDDHIREANQAHLLNYQSDDSEDSDDFAQNIKEQKEDLVANDAWGTKKQGFYGRDKKKDEDSSSDDDQDEHEQAMQLQKIRARKLQQQNAQMEEESQEEEEKSEQEESGDESSEEEKESKGKQKLGDQLFGNGDNKIEVLQQMDKKLMKQMIEKESPELKGLLKEFQESLDQLNNKLQPLMDKCRKEGKDFQLNKGMTYLEMKYNLLLSYCTFLSFYLLMKLEGKEVTDHPVIFKLAHIKTLMEKLRPLDQKLQYQIDKLLRSATLAKTNQKQTQDDLKFKPNLQNFEDSQEKGQDEEGEESEIEEGEEEAKILNDSDSEVEQKRKQIYKAAKLNPVLYEDKETKKKRREEIHQKKKLAKSSYIDDVRRELYDQPEEFHVGFTNKKSKFHNDQDQLEKLEQEHFKRASLSKKEKKRLKQQQQEDLQDRLDNLDDLRDIENIVGGKRKREKQEMEINAELDNKQFQKGLKNYINNAQKKSKKLAQGEDAFEESNFKKKNKSKNAAKSEERVDKRVNFNDLKASGKIKGDQVYEEQENRKREKKALKKELHREEKKQKEKEVERMEFDIERNINRDIMKAKGLTRKRKKIDRNPRVKHREKYRKKMIQLNSKVQVAKEGPQKQYKGESSGLKSNLIKSTKLS